MDKWEEYKNAQKKTETLKKSHNAKDHEKILQMLLEAGNQVGIIDGIFSEMNCASSSFKKFIVPKVLEHQFYRYKCVVDGIARAFDLDFPIKDSKKFIIMLNDILSGDYQKFLDTTDTHIIYTLFNTLYMLDKDVYNSYYNAALVSEDKYKRFMAFYFTLLLKSKLAICNEYFMQDDIEMYAVLLPLIPSYLSSDYFRTGSNFQKYYELSGNGEVETELYYKLCALQERLPKKNMVYKASEQIWFQHSIDRDTISSKIFYLLVALKDKELVRHYEENYYNALDASEKIGFINQFKDQLTLDYRNEMLNYFSYTGDRYNEQIEKYFTSEPLTYKEAVIVSDYLKTKKTNIKKHIVEHYQNICDTDKAKLKDYLENASEEYKQEVAKDLGVVKDIKVEPKAKTCKFPEIVLNDMPESKVVDCFNPLKDFVITNKDYQYKSSSGEDILFGDRYCTLKQGEYPLLKESDDLIKSFDLAHDELVYLYYAFCMMRATSCRYSFNTTSIGKNFDKIAIVEKNRNLACEYFSPMIRHHIQSDNSVELQKSILFRALFVMGNTKIPSKSSNDDDNLYISKNQQKPPSPLWVQLRTAVYALLNLIQFELLDKEALTLYVQAFKYSLENEQCPQMDLYTLFALSYLHRTGVVNDDELFHLLINNVIETHLLVKTPPSYYSNNKKDMYLYSGKHTEEYVDLIEKAIMYMLDVEIQRSQAETKYSHSIACCHKLMGIKYYLKALQSFQKMTLPRSNYSWRSTKDNVFANILQSTMPHKADTYELFARLIKELKLSDKDLVKGALFNNNELILEWTDKYLDKKGFISAVMFFKTHLRDAEVSDKIKDKIVLYSPIDIMDFQEGAVDIDWFWQIKNEIDDITFQMVYDNAKYITVANMHKRAQRFNDALTGKLSKEECLDKIKGTRNKEFLLFYSLIPLEDDKDIDARYALIMQFMQESKQYGAQRQASEKKACEVALENLARQKGYDDTDRFVWYMESKSAELIAPYFAPKPLGDSEVYLKISDRYKVTLAAIKNGKATATIPASIKNDDYVKELKAAVPILNKQSARVTKSLEAAMEREAKFTMAELSTIAQNPLIERILSALFFVADDKIRTYDELADGKIAECVIAHPLDLHNLGVWADKQKYLLSNKIRQPFKQAFRELYPKNEDEKGAMETNRYYGHQINVQKAIAVAKGRGWHSGKDIGLQKVFYRENIVAVLFGIWDYGYSSFDDDPTLSSIYFVNRKTFEIIPISDINDKMFSEVMRDVDLIVSTSHPQGYDFEESLSTVEVRRQICRNIADLLDLDNVTIDGNFVKIIGTMGEYSVNLRSAIASKLLSGALNIMAINDSTQNKLFIDFIDDNPVTVEVVSKMLLLADDRNIKDSNIIRQLKA